MDKRIRVLNTLRAAISHSMHLHPEFTIEYCDSSSFYGCRNGEYCSCSECVVNSNSKKCTRESCGCKCIPAHFMVSFYDTDHKRLVGNWLNNSFQSYPFITPKSTLISKLAWELNLDIEHLMWEQSDELLHRVRYIRVGLRDETYEEAKKDFHIKEVGIEYLPFELKWQEYEEEYYLFDEGEK